MTRPGIRPKHRPAPHCQRELHMLMAKPVKPTTPWWVRAIRSLGGRLLRFRQGAR